MVQGLQEVGVYQSAGENDRGVCPPAQVGVEPDFIMD